MRQAINDSDNAGFSPNGLKYRHPSDSRSRHFLEKTDLSGHHSIVTSHRVRTVGTECVAMGRRRRMASGQFYSREHLTH